MNELKRVFDINFHFEKLEHIIEWFNKKLKNGKIIYSEGDEKDVLS